MFLPFFFIPINSSICISFASFPTAPELDNFLPSHYLGVYQVCGVGTEHGRPACKASGPICVF